MSSPFAPPQSELEADLAVHNGPLGRASLAMLIPPALVFAVATVDWLAPQLIDPRAVHAGTVLGKIAGYSFYGGVVAAVLLSGVAILRGEDLRAPRAAAGAAIAFVVVEGAVRWLRS